MKNNFFLGLFSSAPAFLFNEDAVSSAEQDEPGSHSNTTGVERYIQNKPSITGVDKYLLNNQAEPATGVSKYLARQILADDKPSVTGVEKYISRHEKADKMPASSVAKYVSKQILKGKERAFPSTVEAYLLRKEREENAKIATTGVGKFIQAKEKAARKLAAQQLVAECIKREEEAREAAAKLQEQQQVELETVEMAEEIDPNATGVDKYLSQKSSQGATKVTGVAKYVAKKIALANAAPLKTGVEKYLSKQVLQIKETPTGVSKYLMKQAAKPRLTADTTGVDKYLAKKDSSDATEAKSSTVSRYIAKLSFIQRPAPEIKEASVEQEAQPTGVEKYLQEKAVTVESVNAEGEGVAVEDVDESSLTGVEKYLRTHKDRALFVAEPVTGVEKYLRNKR